MKILQSDLQVVELKCARKTTTLVACDLQPPSLTDKTLCWRTRVMCVPNYSLSCSVLYPCNTYRNTPVCHCCKVRSNRELIGGICTVCDCFVAAAHGPSAPLNHNPDEIFSYQCPAAASVPLVARVQTITNTLLTKHCQYFSHFNSRNLYIPQLSLKMR